MKSMLIALALVMGLGVCSGLRAQEMLHSHNDYTHARPFWDAYQARAGSIEADVFPVSGKLMVAHAREAIRSTRTLDSMYLEPIVKLFRTHGDRTVSDDPHYTFYLMIDIKEHWKEALPLLTRLLEQYPKCFDRNVNPMAVQVFISGDRPPDTTFHDYPPVIRFDGLPGIRYRARDLSKVVMISTDFSLYSHWNGKGTIPAADAGKLSAVIAAAHALKLPVRFWGAPDTPGCWKTLMDLGADVINTDQVDTVRKFLEAAGREVSPRKRAVAPF